MTLFLPCVTAADRSPRPLSVAERASLSVADVARQHHDCVDERPNPADTEGKKGHRDLGKTDTGIAEIEPTDTESTQEQLEQSSCSCLTRADRGRPDTVRRVHTASLVGHRSDTAPANRDN